MASIYDHSLEKQFTLGVVRGYLVTGCGAHAVIISVLTIANWSRTSAYSADRPLVDEGFRTYQLDVSANHVR